MSRHRLVKNLDADDVVSEFDGDNYDEEEDELSPEDRVAMANGTAEVRLALGTESNKVTTDQIQEALWHYYYDVDKSITYLMKTYIAPPPKPTPKKAPEGESYAVSFSASRANVSEVGAGHSRLVPAHSLGDPMELPPPTSQFPAPKPIVSHSWFFRDMPWLDVPKDRQTIFIEPLHPRGGLLGGGEGAPKISKLQALAAARKRKNEEKKDQVKTLKAEDGIAKLSLEDSNKENRRPGLAKRHKATENPDQQFNLQPSAPGSQAQRPMDETSAPDVVMGGLGKGQADSPWDIPKDSESLAAPTQAAAPSAFAQTLFGPAPKTSQPNVFQMPYTSSPFFSAQAFDEPSPDDVVLAAQAKGSSFTRTK
jgi:elongation factor 1 alpha-like protein